MSQANAPYLNKVIIVGTLVREPELRYTTARIPVANFRISASKKYRDDSGAWRDDTCYIGVVAWQDLAQDCVGNLRKGDMVLIEGELKSRVRNDGNGARRSYVEIRANQIQPLNRPEQQVPNDDNGGSFELSENDSGSIQGEPVTAPVGSTDSSRSNYDYEENDL